MKGSEVVASTLVNIPSASEDTLLVKESKTSII